MATKDIDTQWNIPTIPAPAPKKAVKTDTSKWYSVKIDWNLVGWAGFGAALVQLFLSR